MKVLTELLKYQRRGVVKLNKFNGRALLGDEMGLGKTIQSLTWAIENLATPLIVVCPAYLKYNWQHEAWIHFDLRARVLEGRSPPKGKKAIDDLKSEKMVVINYDILSEWMNLLKRLDPLLVIIDECQFLKGRGTLRTKKVRELCKGVEHVIALSGTPVTNRPADLWPTLNIIRPDIFGSFTSFAFEYCEPRKTPWGWEYKGAANTGLLHKELRKTLMIRRLKKNVLKDLPPKTRSVVPLELSDSEEYEEAEGDFLKWLAKTSKHKAKKARRAEQLVRHGYLKRLAARLKLPALRVWVEEFLNQTDEKLILFGIHRPFMEYFERHFKGCSVRVDGRVSAKAKDHRVRQFNKSKGCRLFIGQEHACGAGINLVSSSTVGFGELDWLPVTHLQCEDRAHRIGQVNPTMNHYFVGVGTMEMRLCRLIQSRQRIVEQILDGVGESEGTELNIFDLLEDTYNGS